MTNETKKELNRIKRDIKTLCDDICNTADEIDDIDETTEFHCDSFQSDVILEKTYNYSIKITFLNEYKDSREIIVSESILRSIIEESNEVLK